MGLLGLKYDDIAALAPAVITARGWAYYQEERVFARIFLGDRIAARVVGSDRDYRTVVAENEKGLCFECDCPFDGPVCKHAVALLFSWILRRTEFADVTLPVARLAGMPAGLAARLLTELAGADWLLFREAASRVAGSDWTESDCGGDEGVLLGLAHRELTGASMTFDRVDSLASRIEASLSTLASQMTLHNPAAVRALLRLAGAGFSFWPSVDDVDGVLASTLEQAACELSAASRWPELSEEIALDLAGFLGTLSMNSSLPLPLGRPAALSGLSHLAGRRVLPPLTCPSGEDLDGQLAEDFYASLVEGWLQGTGSSDVTGLEMLLKGACVAVGGRGGWSRRLATLAGSYWRNRPIQELLSRYARSHAGDGTAG